MAGTGRATRLAKHQLKCSVFLNSFTVIVELISFRNFTSERKTELEMISVIWKEFRVLSRCPCMNSRE